MLKYRFYLIVVLIINSTLLYSQTQLKHEKRIYIAPSGRFYINRSLPVYISLSTSKGPNAKYYLLKSEKNEELTDPISFQNEGYNPIRVAVVDDPVTRTKKPLNLDVFIDGSAPLSIGKLVGAKEFKVQEKSIYGPGLKLDITAKDEHSGVENTYFSINEAAYKPYKEPLTFEKEGTFNIKYYSSDNVGNAENPKSLKFTVDLTPPTTTLLVEGGKLENTLSPKSIISLKREDNISGALKTQYILDDNPLATYVKPITCSGLTDGEHSITFFSIDNVNNVEDKTKPSNNFKFYLDRKVPEVDIIVEGDQYQSPANFFISGRSKIKIETSDNHSGIDKVTYLIKGAIASVPIQGVPPTEYSQPFSISEKGPQIVIAQASDKIGNSKQKNLKLYVDNEFPTTGIKFGRPQTFSSELSILCITSKTKISLFMTQYDSGVKFTKYTIDGGPEKEYTEPFVIEKEGKHKIQFYTVDNVNNQEKTKTSWVLVDDTPPTVDIRFPTPATKKTLNTGKVIDAYPPRSRMYLDTKDNYSGVKLVTFSINGGNPIEYEKTSSAVMEELFMEEKYYSVKAEVTDKLGNTGIKVFEFVIAAKK